MNDAWWADFWTRLEQRFADASRDLNAVIDRTSRREALRAVTRGMLGADHAEYHVREYLCAYAEGPARYAADAFYDEWRATEREAQDR